MALWQRGPAGRAILIVFLLGTGPAVAPAAEPDPWVGKRVITKYGTVLKVGKAVVDDADWGKNLARGKDQNVSRVYRVERTNGPWLWLVAEESGARGWMQAAQVIPFDQAIDYITAEIRANPGVATYYNDRGLVWSDRHEYDIAIADYNAAIRHESNEAIYFNNRGNAWYKKKEYDKAIADYNEAIRLDPKYADAFHSRGYAWGDKKEYDKAIADYNEAIRLDPKFALAFINRGIAWGAKKEYDKAIADDNEAIRLDPKGYLPFFNRGVIALIQSHDGASADAETGLEHHSWRGEYSLYLALLGHFGHRQMHRDAEARKLLDRAAEKGDTAAWPFPVIRYLRGDLAEKALLDAATDDDKRTEARTYLGLDLSLKGKPEEALPHLRWVQEHGNPAFVEYPIAVAELERIEGKVAETAQP